MWHRRHFVVFQPLSPSFFAVVFRLVVFKKKCFVVLGEPKTKKKVKSPELDFFLPFFLFFLSAAWRAGWPLGAGGSTN